MADKHLGKDCVQSLATNGNNLYVGTESGGLFLSTNDGTDWVPVDQSLSAKDISCIGVFNQNIYVGTYSNSVFISSVGGANWLLSNAGLQYKGISGITGNEADVYVSNFNENYTGKGGVFLSENNGISWIDINSNLTKTHIHSIVADGNNIFAGAYGKVFFTKDKGVNWLDVSSGIANNTVVRLVIVGNYLYAGIQSNGIYKLDISALGVEDQTTNTIFISPNPAGDFITISLKPSEGFKPSEGSEILIYNTLGEKVMAVEQTFLSVQQINISALPRGIYFVKAGGETAKFVKM